MPRFEIITESSTFLTYVVEAASKKQARSHFGAGLAVYTGATETLEKLVDIRNIPDVTNQKPNQP